MAILDPILNPLLRIDPFVLIVGISFVVSLFITFLYKWMTDQTLMKALKEDMKKSQKEMKKLKDNPQKMMKKQKEVMQKNMQYMMQSLKPTLFTFLPIILVFAWLAANLAFEPIQPGSEFDITVHLNSNVYGSIEVLPPPSGIQYEGDEIVPINSREMVFDFVALEEGIWEVGFRVNNESEYFVSFLVDEFSYSNPDHRRFAGDDVRRIVVGNEKKIVLNLFGWEMGWLITYILFSIVFSIGLRRLLKVY
ncbi:MAG: EMC3/TMCO1 family protein [Candidatus Woesearchaeota archaeon]